MTSTILYSHNACVKSLALFTNGRPGIQEIDIRETLSQSNFTGGNQLLID